MPGRQLHREGQATDDTVGTVYAPNGTLPLYGVNVYVPRERAGAVHRGRAVRPLRRRAARAAPIARRRPTRQGNFRLENVPAADNIPLVIQVGKWRRQIVDPATSSACDDTPLAATETRLPKNKTEGDLPKIAITTGGADALECLVRKLGIDDSEFTTDTGAGRVHMFAGSGGVNRFTGGADTFPNAQTLWETRRQRSSSTTS